MSNNKSDIGNFYNYLQAYSKQNLKDLSFLSNKWEDLEEWKKAATKYLLDCLHYHPEPCPLDAKIVQVIEKEGYRQEEVEFNTAKNMRVKGSLLIPKGNQETYPAIVALHDHSGIYYYGREKIMEQENESDYLTRFKADYYGGRSWANEMVHRGYIVLTIDAFYFGSRKLELQSISDEVLRRSHIKLAGLEEGDEEYIEKYNQFTSSFESLLVKHIFISGTTWPGILFHDDKVSVDYLLTRKEVDKNRIGCAGLSMGAFRAVHLAALDSRIKCTVAAGWMATYTSLLWGHLRDHTYMIYIPQLTERMELPDVASLAAPHPLFIQQCARDELFPMEGMKAATHLIEEVYSKLGTSDSYQSKFYPNPHQFNVEMQEDAFAWFDQWLGDQKVR